MADLERVHLLGRVAHMYYEQNVTQEAIAAAFQVSRPTVSRLLKEAREEGVVQIVIHSPFRYAADVESGLVRAFPHLKEVRVLCSPEPDTVARAAAAYLGSTVRDGDIIGVSWGNTLEAVSRLMPGQPLQGATVVQLNGGVSKAGSGTNAQEIAARFGRAFGAEVYCLQVPAIVDSTQVYDALLQNRETARLLDLGRRATVAVYAIGVPEPNSALAQAGYFTPEYLRGLRQKGAVGDICSRSFTETGAVCDPDLDSRTIGLPLAALARVERSIAVVSGTQRAAGTLGALRGGFMNVLIIDEATAREILRRHQGA